MIGNDISPECQQRGCLVTRTYVVRTLQYVYQHNDNPEAVLMIDRISAYQRPAAEVRRQLREWAERIHKYESGEPLDDARGQEG